MKGRKIMDLKKVLAAISALVLTTGIRKPALV